jgi:hypothetical protein
MTFSRAVPGDDFNEVALRVAEPAADVGPRNGR